MTAHSVELKRDLAARQNGAIEAILTHSLVLRQKDSLGVRLIAPSIACVALGCLLASPPSSTFFSTYYKKVPLRPPLFFSIPVPCLSLFDSLIPSPGHQKETPSL